MTLRVVVNSFTGNNAESENSKEVIRILCNKKIKISEIIDINQELIFEKEKSKNFINFRNKIKYQRILL